MPPTSWGTGAPTQPPHQDWRHDTIGRTTDDSSSSSPTDTTTFEGVAEASTGAGTGVLLLPALLGCPSSTLLARAHDGFLVFAPDDHPAVAEVTAWVSRRGGRRARPRHGYLFLGIDDRGKASMSPVTSTNWVTDESASSPCR